MTKSLDILREGLSKDLASLGSEAIGALRDVMEDPTQLGASNKIKAASKILDKIMPIPKEKQEIEFKQIMSVIELPKLTDE